MAVFMEQPLPEFLTWRPILIAVPFVCWFIWRAWARRLGKDVGATPYAWLVAAAAFLVGLSLAATVVLHPDNRHERYVPGEVTASGDVTKGHFEAQPKPPQNASK
jgi:hypothetical protein